MNVYIAGIAVVLISFFLGSPSEVKRESSNPYPYDKLVFYMDKRVDDEWYVVKTQLDWDKYASRSPIENINYSKEMIVVIKDEVNQYDIDSVMLSKDRLVVNRIIVSSNMSVTQDVGISENIRENLLVQPVSPPVRHIAVIFNKITQVIEVN